MMTKEERLGRDWIELSKGVHVSAGNDVWEGSRVFIDVSKAPENVVAAFKYFLYGESKEVPIKGE